MTARDDLVARLRAYSEASDVVLVVEEGAEGDAASLTGAEKT